MIRFKSTEWSRPVAIWLFVTAFFVVAMVVIGGVTRLTGSGLSITEWDPIMGAIPPLNEADWNEAFAKYREIPQYAQLNAGMSLDEFKGIFFWEWLHRLWGRLIGAVFAIPMLVFLVIGEMPRRLFSRCLVLLALGGLQGLIGWWMVTSGLEARVDVAPERLATHLGLAFLIFAGLIWTGLEAWFGPERSRSPGGWTWGAGLLLAAVFLQCLLGGLVAGAKAGYVHTDWPMMSGQLFPDVDWGRGAIAFLHDQALVQFNHRIVAYALLLAATLYAVQTWRWKLAHGLGAGAYALAGVLWLQALIGIATLMHAVPLWLGIAHQLGAAVVLTAGTVNLWLVRRSQPRLFTTGRTPRGL